MYIHYEKKNWSALFKPGWQKFGKYSYFPGHWEILYLPGIIGISQEIKYNYILHTFNHIFWNVDSSTPC